MTSPVSRETSLGPLAFIRDYLLPETSFSVPSMTLTNQALPLVLFSFAVHRNKTCVLVCPDSLSAEEVYRLCYNFHPSGALYYPARDADSGSVTGFGLRVERHRSEVINALKEQTPRLVVSTDDALREEALTPPKAAPRGYSLHTGDRIGRGKLITDLSAWGYIQEESCSTPKTFAVRGGIVDVFLLYSAYPLRIEFFGDEIDSMRLYNPLSQRKVNTITSVEILPPPGVIAQPEHISFLERYSGFQKIVLRKKDDSTVILTDSNLPDLTFHRLDRFSLSWLRSHPEDFRTMISSRKSLVIFTETTEQVHALQSHFPQETLFVSGSLDFNFDLPSQGILGLSAARLYNRTSTTKTRWDIETSQRQTGIASISDLDWGDYLVHQDYGVGRYRGLEKVSSKSSQQECIRIEYANNGAVFVPVEKFNRVHKLVASPEAPPVLSTLGTKRWQQQKRRVKSVTAKVIQEIIEAYRSRQRPRGFAYAENDELYAALVASFPYDETADQQQAIRDVMNDLDRPVPMDRLICGDVGFGKTEVALRAALRVIVSGKKVLFLTPTTILADQHFISTKSRLEPLGVRVELLSRFRTVRQQKEILENMITGRVDLVIGTHRLLSADVGFPELGLLIIDEEHRFGVRHKEKLRQLKLSVDVITLTATPIPRTLQQSLTGIRQISRIETPPKARKPIQTSVCYFDWDRIERALKYELDRRGQVYFLHNDVLALPFMAEEVHKRFPKAQVAIAHGQMKSRDLERIILSFFAGEIDVLICTTIIESGLDVSNANTIIINDAHRFGLAQLYQIRGRVGRSYRQSYCYLCIPRGRTLGKSAYRRLKAIEEFTTLGSGYHVAMKDLEIRGAGNIFGYRQSGHVAAVGFELYCKLLQEAVDEALGKRGLLQPPKIVFRGDALLPSETMPLVQDRLYFYQRLSAAESEAEIRDIHDELRDRYGPLPKPAARLLEASRLRIRFTGSAISRIVISLNEVTLDFSGIEPFNSLDQLLTATTQTLGKGMLPYQFLPGKNDTLTLKLSTGSEDESFRSAHRIAELFSINALTEQSTES